MLNHTPETSSPANTDSKHVTNWLFKNYNRQTIKRDEDLRRSGQIKWDYYYGFDIPEKLKTGPENHMEDHKDKKPSEPTVPQTLAEMYEQMKKVAKPAVKFDQKKEPSLADMYAQMAKLATPPNPAKPHLGAAVYEVYHKENKTDARYAGAAKKYGIPGLDPENLSKSQLLNLPEELLTADEKNAFSVNQMRNMVRVKLFDMIGEDIQVNGPKPVERTPFAVEICTSCAAEKSKAELPPKPAPLKVELRSEEPEEKPVKKGFWARLKGARDRIEMSVNGVIDRLLNAVGA